MKMTIDNLVSDHEANKIYEENYPIIFNYLRRKKVPQEEAEEFTHQALAQGMIKLDQYRGDSKLSTWLVRIAINEYGMCLRDKKVRYFNYQFATEYTELTDPIDYGESITQDVLRQQAFDLIYSTLSEKHTTVLKLLQVGYSQKEMAELLNLSFYGLKGRVFKARKKAKEVIKKEMNLTIQDLM